MAIPAELRTGRLYLRRWQPGDAAALLPILESNTKHLRPWIPRHVHEPIPIADLVRRLEGFAAAFNADREWRFALFTADAARLLGEVSLFPRNAGGRVPLECADRAEIGYWLRKDLTGRGLASEAAQAMMDLAATLPGIGRIEIRCDARNAPSAAIPRRLGFRLDQAAGPAGDAFGMVWYFEPASRVSAADRARGSDRDPAV